MKLTTYNKSKNIEYKQTKEEILADKFRDFNYSPL